MISLPVVSEKERNGVETLKATFIARLIAVKAFKYQRRLGK